MFSPKYNITNAILKHVGTIDAAREVIENAPLVPAYEKQFREDALLRQVHHGTHLEGNDLSYTQAERVILHADEKDPQKLAERADVAARDRDIQEVINYRRVIEFLDKIYSSWKQRNDSDGVFQYSEDTLREIHKLTVDKLVSEDQLGTYRITQVVLKDSRTGEVTFRPPPAIEVPYLMEDAIAWLDLQEARQIHPVLRAGIMHYLVAAVHPFVEGNGRAARAFATLVLLVEGYDIKRLFALEEYFDKDAAEYYGALMSVSNQSPDLSERDLTLWIEYFTQGLAIELSKVKDRVRKISFDTNIKEKIGGRQIALSERQIKIVEYLSKNGTAGMADLRELFPMVSDDTVLREMQSLQLQGVVKKRGHTKGAKYVLIDPAAAI